MANLFGNRQQNGQISERALLESKYNISRHNLLLVVVFSVINLIMTLLDSGVYFLFSAFLPLFSVSLGMELCGKYSPEYYNEVYGEYETLEFSGDGFFYATIAIAVVMIALYLICWFMSKNQKSAWLIVALVLFAIDTAVMLLLSGISVDMIVDILFHAWVVYYLIIGITSASKLKKLSPEEQQPLEGEFAPATETDGANIAASVSEEDSNKGE